MAQSTRFSHTDLLSYYHSIVWCSVCPSIPSLHPMPLENCMSLHDAFWVCVEKATDDAQLKEPRGGLEGPESKSLCCVLLEWQAPLAHLMLSLWCLWHGCNGPNTHRTKASHCWQRTQASAPHAAGAMGPLCTSLLVSFLMPTSLLWPDAIQPVRFYVINRTLHPGLQSYKLPNSSKSKHKAYELHSEKNCLH